MTIWQRFLWRFATSMGREIAESLSSDPTSWNTTDGYWLRNQRLGTDVWIANADYGLRLQVWPTERGFPGSISPEWADRSLIWSMVKQRREPSPDALQRARALDAMRARKAA